MVTKESYENIEFKDESQISKAQWKDILQNKEITSELDFKTVLTVFNSPQYRSTATEIASVLGESSYRIISSGNTSFARRICAYLNKSHRKIIKVAIGGGLFHIWAHLKAMESGFTYCAQNLKKQLKS